MTTPLLREFNQQHVDWLVQASTLRSLQAGDRLHTSNQPLNHLWIVVSGQLSVVLEAPSADEGGKAIPKEILRLSTGDLTGALPAVTTYLSQSALFALTDATVLALPLTALTQKLADDADFAAPFYRVVALTLRQQLTQWAAQMGYSVALLGQLQLKEAATVFAELADSDLDWMMAVGQVESVKPGTPLFRCGYPVDALHLLLEGAVGLNAAEQPPNLVVTALMPDPDRAETEFARLSRGDLVGETLLLDSAPAAVGAITLRESTLLTIPRWRLLAKLLYDRPFAARLYRLLALLLASKQQLMLQKLGALAPNSDLDSQLLERVALAEARFEWLVQRLQTQAQF
ncbi:MULTISPECIES: cyclic nucleotide-binding domain-containing protein [Cyanophyceae]|uniref:Cyclic nucleotide-binding domain-containing protein n=1 Tax=Leptolyngbya subtilissima DQ-A4 TaxID=2933933 RepID=A0ABV0K9E0_9CYAN|nr:cyclic nucleotide-binding domain-containing protein [Nodosilinea sp. FACHB-141]MBD2110319.1 cyclic nucleotide-binding domain-containing protein [Nodosilinea sp. FACHB-141]